MKKPNFGFSLIELMVTVTIISILLAIAIPSYQTYVLRGQVVAATSGLSTLHAQMEQYYQDNRTYNATGGYVPPCTTAAKSGNFTFTCVIAADPATTYTITATGSGQMAGFSYTIDQNNDQGTTAIPSSWGSATTSCWIVSPDQTC